MTNIDETELARLEELAGKIDMLPVDVGDLVCLYIDGLDECRSSYIAAACNAVPALVAEVRRLREKIKQNGIDYCSLMKKHDAQFTRAEKNNEEVHFLAGICAVHCRDKSFDNAQCSVPGCTLMHCNQVIAAQWESASHEAVHADSE